MENASILCLFQQKEILKAKNGLFCRALGVKHEKEIGSAKRF